MPDDKTLFHAQMEFPYDLGFARAAQGWLVDTAAQGGADEKEQSRLALALDEVLTFLIGAYPDAEPSERIGLTVRLAADGGFTAALANAGPPLHPDSIPTYDPAAPLESETQGLWHFLAAQAVDELRFDNLGMQGWRVTLGLGLEAPSYTPRRPAVEDAEEAGRKISFTCRPARPDDAPAIVDLTYGTYGYTYANEIYYHEDRLRAALADGSICASVAEANGVVVGNSTISVSPHKPRCGHLGSVMVHKDFRRSRAILHLIRETKRFMQDNPQGVDLFYGSLVTAHGGSQKAAQRADFSPLALIPCGGFASHFQGIKATNPKRETFLICVLPARPFDIPTLYLPRRHHEAMAPLLQGIHCEAPLSDQEVAPVGETAFSEHVIPTFQAATLSMTAIGEDWRSALRRKLFDLAADGIRSVTILVPATTPLPPGLDEEMTRQNAIFSGMEPASATHMDLVYCTLPERIDYDSIVLVDPLAQEFSAYHKALYEESFSR